MFLPPFGDGGPGGRQAWLKYQAQAQRPAGGLAPAADWKADGNSWTPETALVAYTAAASGHTARSRAWLGWLDAHRTAYGSLPEKVTASGQPAGPAPLLWTAALVLLTLDELDRR
jgi:GH15 family glucan-1,4-alpha-glucosidase